MQEITLTDTSRVFCKYIFHRTIYRILLLERTGEPEKQSIRMEIIRCSMR